MLAFSSASVAVRQSAVSFAVAVRTLGSLAGKVGLPSI